MTLNYDKFRCQGRNLKECVNLIKEQKMNYITYNPFLTMILKGVTPSSPYQDQQRGKNILASVLADVAENQNRLGLNE